jgi:hypothetical protein
MNYASTPTYGFMACKEITLPLPLVWAMGEDSEFKSIKEPIFKKNVCKATFAIFSENC